MLNKKIIIPIEAIILQVVEELAQKYKLDREVIINLLTDYDNLVSPYLRYEYGAESLISVN